MIDSDALGQILDRAGAVPVLVDVGASGKAHEPWQPVARKSIFVGFDPDSRDIDPALRELYAQHHMIPKIVAGVEAKPRVPFYLTAFPHCSSMLEPDEETLRPYIFADLFRVERTVEFETTTLSRAMDDLRLPAIDWLKVDSQGADLSIIRGLDAERRRRLLCIEIEPGFTAFYRGEETFADVHKALTGEGFWLAHFKAQQFPRVRKDTVREVFGLDLRATDPAAKLFGASPTAAEARYFPSLSLLEARNAPFRDYAVAWTFAVVTGLWGYALELARAASPTASDPNERNMAQFLINCVKTTVIGLANQAP
jgi:FkbM family methyltransferase